MPIIFDEHTSRLGGKHLMSDEPFAVIREGGEIYLSGDYTIEELREILKAAEQCLHTDPPTARSISVTCPKCGTFIGVDFANTAGG